MLLWGMNVKDRTGRECQEAAKRVRDGGLRCLLRCRTIVLQG